MRNRSKICAAEEDMAMSGSAPGRSSPRRQCPRRGSGWSCARWTDRLAAAAAAAQWRAPQQPMRAAPTAPDCSSRHASEPRPNRCPACRFRCPTAASLSPAYRSPRNPVYPGVKIAHGFLDKIPYIIGAKSYSSELVDYLYHQNLVYPVSN